MGKNQSYHQSLKDKFKGGLIILEAAKGAGIAIIGGGTARTALRLSSEKMTHLYRQSRVEMPAHHEEISATEHEGIPKKDCYKRREKYDTYTEIQCVCPRR